MKIIVTVLLFMSSSLAFSYNDKKCFGMYTKNALRKYDYKYLGPTSVTSDTTTKEGSTKVTTQNSTQGSTMAVDPTVFGKRFISSTQYSSSFGECAMFGFHDMEKERQYYIAVNTADIKRDIAFGKGTHIDALSKLSGCTAGSAGLLGSALKSKFSQIQDLENDSYKFSEVIHQTIIGHSKLKQRCLQFPEVG